MKKHNLITEAIDDEIQVMKYMALIAVPVLTTIALTIYLGA